LAPHTNAAPQRILTSADCSRGAGRGAKKDSVDSQQLARPDSLRRDAAVSVANVSVGAGALERTRYLPLRGCIWRSGPSSPGDDPRVRRSRAVRTFSLALYFRADFFAIGLRRFLLVGSQGDHSDRFLLGRLAWDDADLRLLSNLRRENRLLCCADAPARLCGLCRLVRRGGAPFTATHGRHAGNVL